MNALEKQYVELLKKTLSASIYEESSWRIIDDRISETRRRPLTLLKQFVYGLIVRLFRKRSILLVKRQTFDPQRRNMGLDWPLFGYTMTGQKRLDNVEMCIEDILLNNVPGDFAETGVWRGGTTIFMRALLKLYNVTNRTVWAADSYEGMPIPASSTDGHDFHSLEYLSVSLEQVKKNFAKFDLLDDQVQFIKGWFSDTLPKSPIKSLALLRLDGDMYSSTMDSLNNLYRKVSPGGYVIVDDYHSWESCKRAVTDFINSNRIDVDIKEIDGSAVYWKVKKT